MAKISLPGLSKALGVKPPLPPSTPLSDYIQQSLAVMLGYTYGETVVLHASPAGVLYVAEPRMSDVFHWTAVGANEDHQGADILATQILCIAHPDNLGRVWVRTRQPALSTNAIPLDKGDPFTFSVENLNELYARIVTIGDTLIVAYSL